MRCTRTPVGPSRSATRAGALVGTVLLAVGLVAACDTPASPTPTPSLASPTTGATSESPTPTATPSPTPSAEETHIAEAKQTLLDYYYVLNEVANGGYATWETRLPPFWGSDFAALEGAYYRNMADTGRRTEGGVMLDGIGSIEYVSQPAGAEQVRLTACSDNSGLTYFAADGSVIEKSLAPRYVVEYLLQRQQSGDWVIMEISPHSDQVC